MKAGLTTSLALHAVVLGFGLVSLSSPREMAIADVESFPVDIVPVEEVAVSVQGDRKAPAAEKPAPVPTSRPEIVENAQEVGDNMVDLKTPPTPDPKPRAVETAETPPPAPKPAPPTPKPEPAPQPKQPEPAPQPVPTTEVAPEPAPRQEVKPDPAPETAVAEAPAEETVQLPQTAPTPQARPQPPKAESARTPERREPERAEAPRRETASSSRSERTPVEDQVAALLNREKASGGGARRSSEPAALGGRQTTGAQLSQSEKDAIIAQLRSCWNVPVGAEGSSELTTRVRFRLDPGGTLEGAPAVEHSSGNRQFDESTTRAIQICSRRGFQLPAGKYDSWSEVVVNFSPRDMF